MPNHWPQDLTPKTRFSTLAEYPKILKPKPWIPNTHTKIAVSPILNLSSKTWPYFQIVRFDNRFLSQAFFNILKAPSFYSFPWETPYEIQNRMFEKQSF